MRVLRRGGLGPPPVLHLASIRRRRRFTPVTMIRGTVERKKGRRRATMTTTEDSPRRPTDGRRRRRRRATMTGDTTRMNNGRRRRRRTRTPTTQRDGDERQLWTNSGRRQTITARTTRQAPRASTNSNVERNFHHTSAVILMGIPNKNTTAV